MLVEMKDICKDYPQGKETVRILKNINLQVEEGDYLAIMGPSGSGKTTLMNMIAGIYHPDEGEILVNGERVVINSPKDAFDLKIGMIHQHFKLVDVFDATENIVLGIDRDKRFNLKEAAKRVADISEKYGFDVDPKKKIYQMSVSEKQTVEIIKVLYRGADILILDEPTAVLTPQETEKLFAVLNAQRRQVHYNNHAQNARGALRFRPRGDSPPRRIHRYGYNEGNERSRAYRNDGGQKGFS